MTNPYKAPQPVSESDITLIPDLNRNQCPKCEHRNAIGEMLRSKDYSCRGCGSKLAILLEPRFERLTLGGFIVLIVLAICTTQIKLPFYPPLIFLPQFASIALCLWIYRTFGYLGFPKTPWYSRLRTRIFPPQNHDGG
jgi:hypothetical protein